MPSEKLKALYNAKIEKIEKKIANCPKLIARLKFLKLIWFIISSFDIDIEISRVISKIKLFLFAVNDFWSSINPTKKKIIKMVSVVIKFL